MKVLKAFRVGRRNCGRGSLGKRSICDPSDRDGSGGKETARQHELYLK
jgi:hypothetical protein